MQTDGIAVENVLDHAIKAEKAAEEFYSRAAMAAKEQSHRGMLLAMSSMELEHSSALKVIRDRLLSKPNENPVRSGDVVLTGYLAAWLGEGFAIRSSQELRRIADSGDVPAILEKGIEIEKDGIAFYAGLSRYFTGEETAAALEKIIYEELRHMAGMDETLRALKKTATGSNAHDPAGADGV
jgi:rubrerythrin